MTRVILESPYTGDVDRNVKYALRALYNSLLLGEAPIASHLLYTQVLDDNDPVDRSIGINAGMAWSDLCDYVVVYTDYGISNGIKNAIEIHESLGKRIEYRKIGEN